MRIEEAALCAALKQLRLTNVDVDGVKADVSLKAKLVAADEATTAEAISRPVQLKVPVKCFADL